MIRNIFKTIAMAVAVFSVSSCLEKYPASSIPEKDAMKTFSDAEQHNFGIYSSLKSAYLYSGHLTLLPDLMSDFVWAVEGNTNTYGSFYRWDVLAVDKDLEGVYGSLYAVIGNCNFFLEKVDDVIANETSDENLRNLDLYKGEAYAIRALCYLELLKLYCEAYPGTDLGDNRSEPDHEAAKNMLGVVLRTKYSDPEPVRRASLYDSYRQVVSDLEKAEGLLDEKEDIATSLYVTKGVAEAIHARAALYMREWQDAIDYSTALIEKKGSYRLSSTKTSSTGSGLSDFDYIWNYDSGTEIIWEIGITNTSYGGSLGTVFANYTRDFMYLYPDYVPSSNVISLFGSADGRTTAYFAAPSEMGISLGLSNGLSNDVKLCVKYYGNRNYFQYNLFHLLAAKPFRLAEQYLIRAEAYCQEGEYSKGAKDLTELREARMTSGATVSMNAGNWLQTISDERVRELYMEGFRLHDLKRWNMPMKREKPTGKGYQEEGADLSIPAGDPRFVWPIPKNELDAPGSEIEPNGSNR